MTMHNPASGNDLGMPEDWSIEATRARLAAFCNHFEVPLPKLKVRSGKLYMTDDLQNWFKTAGASIDWICYGGVTGLAHAYRVKALQEQEIRSAIEGLDNEDTAMLKEMLDAYLEKVKARARKGADQAMV